MTGPIFVDSNILIYAHDLDAGAKQIRAAARLRELWESGSGRMSTQVLQEFCVNVTRRIVRPLSGAAAREVVRNYAFWVQSPITPATVIRASEISEAWKLSFWDSMILAAAEQSAATELLTEDSQSWANHCWNPNPQSVYPRLNDTAGRWPPAKAEDSAHLNYTMTYVRLRRSRRPEMHHAEPPTSAVRGSMCGGTRHA